MPPIVLIRYPDQQQIQTQNGKSDSVSAIQDKLDVRGPDA